MPAIESSIIIPVYNKWDLTRTCLKSLAATTDKNRIEVIVVDNASTDITPKACPFLGGQLFGDSFHYIRNDVNRNFAGASNQGAMAARGEFLIFLNNDTEALPGWYQPLIDDFTKFPDIAATGPVLVYPKNEPFGFTVQHLGVLVTPFYKLGHLYEGIPADSPLVQKRRFFQVITGACMVMRRSLFMEIGMFDEAFINGFEDVDICARLGCNGYRMTVNPDARIIHYESQSAGRHDSDEHNSRILEQKSLFTLKPDWQNALNNDNLRLCITDWLAMRPGLPGNLARRLDPIAAKAGYEQLLEMLIAYPYWEKGWEKIIEKAPDDKLKLELQKTGFKYLKNPVWALDLCRHFSTSGDKKDFNYWLQMLRLYTDPPEKLLYSAKTVLTYYSSHGMDDLALQAGQWIENYDRFENVTYRRLAGKIWNFLLKNNLPVPQSDYWVYNIWRGALNLPLRESITADFMESVQDKKPPHPEISILMAVGNPKADELKSSLDSLMAQLWPAWELCLAIENSASGQIRETVSEYIAKDARIRVLWADAPATDASLLTDALSMASNPWAGVMHPGDRLDKDALALMAKAIMENPSASLFFSDEDSIDDENTYFWPVFKDAALRNDASSQSDIVGNFAVYKTEGLRKSEAFGQMTEENNFLMRYSRLHGEHDLIHVPHVLYHKKVGGNCENLATTERRQPQNAAQKWWEGQESLPLELQVH